MACPDHRVQHRAGAEQEGRKVTDPFGGSFLIQFSLLTWSPHSHQACWLHYADSGPFVWKGHYFSFSRIFREGWGREKLTSKLTSVGAKYQLHKP